MVIHARFGDKMGENGKLMHFYPSSNAFREWRYRRRNHPRHFFQIG